MEPTTLQKIPTVVRVRTARGIRPVVIKSIVMVTIEDRRPLVHIWNKAKECVETKHCTSRCLKTFLEKLGNTMLMVGRNIAVNERYVEEVTTERFVHLKVPVDVKLVMGKQDYADYLAAHNVF